MVISTVRILPSLNRRDDVLEILLDVQGPIRAQPGCVDCVVCEEQEEDQAILLIERWDTDVALKAHMRTDAYSRILGAIELSRSPPEVRFDHVSATEGIELIERARGKAGGATHDAGAAEDDRPPAVHAANRGVGRHRGRNQ